MKYISLLSFILVVLLSSCKEKTIEKPAVVTDESVSKVQLIDFYGTHRCVTCEAIEANSKYTIDTYFQDEVKQGMLEFKTVDVDNKDNYDIAERFEASGTALFINLIKDGQEKHIDLTEFAFMKGREKEEFSQELKGRIIEQLAQL